MKRALSHRWRGTTSLVALVTISTLAFIAGSFIVRMTNRSREGFHSASWIEASQMAESAAAVGLAEIRRVLPQTATLPANEWTGWTAATAAGTAALPTDRTIAAGTTLTLNPVTLTHAGEGNTTCTGAVSVDAPASLIDPAGQQWYRVRATGTASLPGAVRVSFSAVDRQMRRLAFVRDGFTGKAVARPQVARSVEWIVQPVPHFGSALQATGLIASNKAQTIDSYDSTDPLKSTSGEYDSRKQQQNGQVCTNSNTLTLLGSILGNLDTNGATVPTGTTVSGKVDTANYQVLAPVSAPSTWGGIGLFSLPVFFSVSAATSTTATPARYHFSYVAAPLTLKANRSSAGVVLPSKVEVWVDGDITSSIIVETGVQATIYLGGSLNVKGTDLSNISHQAANLQIYGIQSASGTTRSIQLNLNADVYAAIYAPGHDFTFSGSGDLFGSFVGESIKLKGAHDIHYDESLAQRAAVIVDYRLASWIEDVH